MYEIFYIHSPSHPLDSVSILENMLEGICQLEDVAKITVYRTDSVDTLPAVSYTHLTLPTNREV